MCAKNNLHSLAMQEVKVKVDVIWTDFGRVCMGMDITWSPYTGIYIYDIHIYTVYILLYIYTGIYQRVCSPGQVAARNADISGCGSMASHCAFSCSYASISPPIDSRRGSRQSAIKIGKTTAQAAVQLVGTPAVQAPPLLQQARLTASARAATASDPHNAELHESQAHKTLPVAYSSQLSIMLSFVHK
eukprot:COSAG03_NODE_1984_length_3260_cov_10.708953_3_plen_188_part_00